MGGVSERAGRDPAASSVLLIALPVDGLGIVACFSIARTVPGAVIHAPPLGHEAARSCAPGSGAVRGAVRAFLAVAHVDSRLLPGCIIGEMLGLALRRERARVAGRALALSALALGASGCRAMLGVLRAMAELQHPSPPFDPGCQSVAHGFGPAGTVPFRVEVVASGLRIPWGVAFLPDGGILVTERPGRLRLIRDGQLVPQPVLTVEGASASGDGGPGLFDVVLHPQFARNRVFYLYYAHEDRGEAITRLQWYRLADDDLSARPGAVMLEGIPSGGRTHNGGRMRFGPDGMLYLSVGEAHRAERAQELSSPLGKILRMEPFGGPARGNPFPDSMVYLRGVRDSQGYDWLPDGTMVVTDHGPTVVDYFRIGRDEVNLAHGGDNLGWPRAWGCEARPGFVAPALSWETSVPPGGAAIYTGDAIPEWRGSLLIGSLWSEHLHRVQFDPANPRHVVAHEVYLLGHERPHGYGRLRTVIMGPDHNAYVTTSNCDSMGDCPRDGDLLLRLTR
jgi:glucose/arabinose dehydrogenase